MNPCVRPLLCLASPCALALLLNGCGGGDSPAGPGDQNPDPTVLVEGTIGSAGGTLADDEFTLEIPAGALAADVDLVVTREGAAGGVGSAPVYSIQGLPATYGEPLTVRLPAPAAGKAAGEVPPLAFGENVFASSVNADVAAWRIAPTTLDAGSLVAQLPARSADDIAGAGDFDAAAATVDITTAADISGQVTSVGGNFRISCPLDRLAQATLLGGYLEEALTAIQGHSFSIAARTQWPIEVTVLPLDSAVYGYAVNSAHGDDSGWLEFNALHLGDADQARATAVHELFHLVQAWYDPRNAYSQSRFAGQQLWLDEAVSTWSEALLVGGADYVSTVRLGQELEPFEGLVQGIGDDAAGHGYGLAGLPKYLIATYGDGALAQVYARLAAGDAPAQALAACFPYNGWWAGFIHDTTRGAVYDDTTPATLRVSATGTATFGSSADGPRTLSASYPDLSGRYYKIEWSGQDFTTDTSLEFSLTDSDARVSVLSYTSTSVTVLGGPAATVTVPDVKTLAETGALVLAVVSNARAVDPWTSAKTIELTVQPVTSLVPGYFDFRWRFSGTAQITRAGVTTTESYTMEDVGSGSGYWQDADNFMAVRHEENYLGVKDYNASFTVDAGQVSFFTITYTETDADGIMSTWSLTGGGIPYYTTSGGTVYYQESGSGTLPLVAVYSFRREFPEGQYQQDAIEAVAFVDGYNSFLQAHF